MEESSGTEGSSFFVRVAGNLQRVFPVVCASSENLL